MYSDPCLIRIFVVAITSNKDGADSVNDHAIEIRVGRQIGRLPLKRKPANNFKFNKRSSRWVFKFKDFNFADKCILQEEIKNVAIVQTGIDDWNIETIVTHVEDSFEKWHTLTEDINVFRWVGADGAERRRFDLKFRLF